MRRYENFSQIDDADLLTFPLIIERYKIPRRTLCNWRESGRLRVIETNRTLTWGKWLRAAWLNQKQAA